MSYSISLVDYETGDPVSVKNHAEGGTYVLGGTTEACLNITYNYAPFYYKHLDKDKGIRWLYGLEAKDTVDRLFAAVKALGTEQNKEPFWTLDINKILDKQIPQEFLDKCEEGLDFDKPENVELLEEGLAKGYIHDGGPYWRPTAGNAGYALNILLQWALQHPDAIWEGD